MRKIKILLISFFLFFIPSISYSLIEVDISRGNLNPLPISVSPLFADKVSNELHLSRLRCADLFLDTFNYNAHTTASDALWANIPIITKQGKSFSARVCSSLLKSLNLDDLIVKDNAEYEEKALHIAKNKDYLMELKDRLNQNKLKSPLFDSEKFTKNIEKLYFKLIKKLDS